MGFLASNTAYNELVASLHEIWLLQPEQFSLQRPGRSEVLQDKFRQAHQGVNGIVQDLADRSRRSGIRCISTVVTCVAGIIHM